MLIYGSKMQKTARFAGKRQNEQRNTENKKGTIHTCHIQRQA